MIPLLPHSSSPIYTQLENIRPDIEQIGDYIIIITF